MKVLVNALSASNVSGPYVLLGHLSNLARWTQGEHEYVVLYHAGIRDIFGDLGNHVTWRQCPAGTAHWARRALWERVALPRIARKLGTDLYFTPSGTVSPRLDVPQVSFAQNPWCLVPGVARRPAELLKAACQRRAYRQAVRKADLMVFNSEFMRRAYRENAGLRERDSLIVYQAASDDVWRAAEEVSGKVQRKPHQILCVSVMAPHKGVETLVRAVHLLRSESGIPARLLLVGSWPHRYYERAMRSLVSDLALEDVVTFCGHIPRADLNTFYAESACFCLMSRCESFGIPAVEAQVFGTPVISSNCCAIPEICGDGGIYPEPGDHQGVADALRSVLAEPETWQRLSTAGRENAQRFRWEECSRPLLRMFELIFDTETAQPSA